MKSRKIKLIALFAAMLFSTTAFSENESSTPIYLYYSRPRIDGIRQPHRAPSNIYLSLEVSYDSSTSQLVFTDSQEHNYYFTITDENDNIISEGYLDFDNQECIYINLGTLVYGTYSLNVFHEGNVFSGSLFIGDL